MPTPSKPLPYQAWIALGGNMGNVRASFQSARQCIHEHPDCSLSASSMLYQTPPLGPAGQADYLNAVIAINTRLAPLALLHMLQDIEHAHGRIRQEHWGPRTLDLDILAYEQLQLASDTLTIPHAQLHQRQFVLKPLCDIAPQWQHPVLKQTAHNLLQSLLKSGEEPLIHGSVW